MTTVGIVIASFNPQRDQLARAVESIRAQTHTEWECVVVDDGSESPIAVANVPVIRHEHRGVPAARNRGVEAVTGDYVAFLDQDDCWSSEKLTRQLAFMQERDLAMSDTDFNIIRAGEAIATGYEYHQGDFSRLLSTARCGLSTLIVRRDVFAHVGGFSPLFPNTSDWEFQLRVAHAGYKFDRLPAILCSYYLHGENASSNYRAMYAEQVALLDLYAAIDHRPAVRAAAQNGRKRMRELYAYQAIDAFRSSRRTSHLVWAARRAPQVALRSGLTKIARTIKVRAEH